MHSEWGKTLGSFLLLFSFYMQLNILNAQCAYHPICLYNFPTSGQIISFILMYIYQYTLFFFCKLTFKIPEIFKIFPVSWITDDFIHTFFFKVVVLATCGAPTKNKKQKMNYRNNYLKTTNRSQWFIKPQIAWAPTLFFFMPSNKYLVQQADQ